MKRVLYIDPILQNGHVKFNKIYINKLNELDVIIDYIFVKGYEKNFNISYDKIIYLIPSILFKYNYGKFGNRICYLISLILVKFHCKFGVYDKIIFSSFEEISFYFSGINNSILINHVNFQNFNSNVKRFFLTRVLKKNKCIVFDLDTKNEVLKYGNFDIIIKPHGFYKQFNFKIDSSFTIKNKDLYNNFIFSPSSNSSDLYFLSSLLNSSYFLNFLKENKILFIVRSNIEIEKNDNILMLNKYLTDQEYSHFFNLSDVILINYPKSFRFRTSGVLFECFEFNKPCLVSDLKGFRNYSKHFNYNPFYNDIESLVNSYFSLKKYNCYYKNLEDLNPCLKDLI